MATKPPKVVATESEPLLDLDTCRRQCGLVAIDADSDGNESHPDDALLTIYLDAAIDRAEAFTGLAIRLRTYELALDSFPGDYIELPRPPLVQLIGITYGDDVSATSDDIYTVDDFGQFARIIPLEDWPVVETATNTIRVQYRAGYSDNDSDAEDVPGDIKAAILLMLAHLFEHRKDTDASTLASIPSGFEALLRPHRVLTGLA